MSARAVFIAALAIIGVCHARAEGYRPYQTDHGDAQPFAMFCPGTDGSITPCGSITAPLNVLGMPFMRKTRSAFILPATITPQQFMVTQPDGAFSYRAYQPCVQADVRIMSVSALEPITTKDTIYPGVKQVTSKTEVIDQFSGLRFGRGSETIGSASNPLGGKDRIISIMLVPIPGYPADLSSLTCEFELHYGVGQ